MFAYFAFVLQVDLPLAAVTLALTFWHFNRWAVRDDLEVTVDVAARLPTARVRVTVFLTSLLLLCWFVDLAFWSVFVVLFTLGCVVAGISGGGSNGAEGAALAAYLVREWSFGFPHLDFEPQILNDLPMVSDSAPSEMIGKVGSTMSPLRPAGVVEVDGVSLFVVSYNGQWVDTGTEITLVGRQDGIYRVKSSV